MTTAKFINRYTKKGFFKFNEKKYVFDAVFETDEEDLIAFLNESSGFDYIGDKEEEKTTNWFSKTEKKEKKAKNKKNNSDSKED